MDTSTMKYPFGRCGFCGKEFNSELRGEFDITHCPWCGGEIDDCFSQTIVKAENGAYSDIFCEDCGLRIYERVGKGGSWITRNKEDKQPGVCSGPCERELCGHCGDWDKEGCCQKCSTPCDVCPKHRCTRLYKDCSNPCSKCPMKNSCYEVTDVRNECHDYSQFLKKLDKPDLGDDVATGWWKASFDLYLIKTIKGKREKVEVRFEDLSEASHEHILNNIKDGCTQGVLVENIEDDK
jgi:hypothetical protein